MNLNLNYFNLYEDNFNIYNLIKHINQNLKLYFNNKDKNFYIINSAKNNEICLKFSHFNQNIIKILQMNRIENAKKIFDFVDDYNNNLLCKRKNDNLNLATEKIKEIVNLSSRALSKTLNYKIN